MLGDAPAPSGPKVTSSLQQRTQWCSKIHVHPHQSHGILSTEYPQHFCGPKWQCSLVTVLPNTACAAILLLETTNSSLASPAGVWDGTWDTQKHLSNPDLPSLLPIQWTQPLTALLPVSPSLLLPCTPLTHHDHVCIPVFPPSSLLSTVSPTALILSSS